MNMYLFLSFLIKVVEDWHQIGNDGKLGGKKRMKENTLVL